MKRLERGIRQHPDGGRILDAIRAAQKDGWTMTPGQPFPDPWPGDRDEFRRAVREGVPKCCCPLSALSLKTFDFYEAAETVLGWPFEKAWAFSHGFDDGKRPGVDDESKGLHQPEFKLGVQVRRLLDPGAFQ